MLHSSVLPSLTVTCHTHPSWISTSFLSDIFQTHPPYLHCHCLNSCCHHLHGGPYTACHLPLDPLQSVLQIKLEWRAPTSYDLGWKCPRLIVEERSPHVWSSLSSQPLTTETTFLNKQLGLSEQKWEIKICKYDFDWQFRSIFPGDLIRWSFLLLQALCWAYMSCFNQEHHGVLSGGCIGNGAHGLPGLCIAGSNRSCKYQSFWGCPRTVLKWRGCREPLGMCTQEEELRGS